MITKDAGGDLVDHENISYGGKKEGRGTVGSFPLESGGGGYKRFLLPRKVGKIQGRPTIGGVIALSTEEP